jgi:hypothetical protein
MATDSVSIGPQGKIKAYIWHNMHPRTTTLHKQLQVITIPYSLDIT